MADPIKHGSLEEPLANTELRSNKNQYARWEYEHIGRVVGFHQRGKRSLVPLKLDSGEVMMVDEVHVAEANGTEHIFYFNVTKQVLAKVETSPPGPKA